MVTQTFIIKLKEEDKKKLTPNKYLYSRIAPAKISAKFTIKRDRIEKNSWKIVCP